MVISSAFLLYLNDLEEMLLLNAYHGIEMYMLKICLLLYADDIVLFSHTPDGLQIGFTILQEYCNTRKMKVNVGKTKVEFFRKSGLLPMNLQLNIMEKWYNLLMHSLTLVFVFTAGGSFNQTQITLAGQSRRAIFKINKYLYNFTNISIKHRLQLVSIINSKLWL